MEQHFLQKMREIISENAERKKLGKKPLSVVDVGLSSSGDVFAFHFFLCDHTEGEWEAEELERVTAKFWLGADAEALSEYQESAIAALRNGATRISSMTMGVSGSGRTTRFMAFVAGVKEQGDPTT